MRAVFVRLTASVYNTDRFAGPRRRPPLPPHAV